MHSIFGNLYLKNKETKGEFWGKCNYSFLLPKMFAHRAPSPEFLPIYSRAATSVPQFQGFVLN